MSLGTESRDEMVSSAGGWRPITHENALAEIHLWFCSQPRNSCSMQVTRFSEDLAGSRGNTTRQTTFLEHFLVYSF